MLPATVQWLSVTVPASKKMAPPKVEVPLSAAAGSRRDKVQLVSASAPLLRMVLPIRFRRCCCRARSPRRSACRCSESRRRSRRSPRRCRGRVSGSGPINSPSARCSRRTAGASPWRRQWSARLGSPRRQSSHCCSGQSHWRAQWSARRARGRRDDVRRRVGRRAGQRHRVAQ